MKDGQQKRRKKKEDKKLRNKQIYRLLGNVPTLAANAYRQRIGK